MLHVVRSRLYCIARYTDRQFLVYCEYLHTRYKYKYIHTPYTQFYFMYVVFLFSSSFNASHHNYHVAATTKKRISRTTPV
jgi:hypothetical protein